MAGRNRQTPNAHSLKVGQAPPFGRPSPPLNPALVNEMREGLQSPFFPPHPLHAALAEERFAAQHQELQSLLLDNQRLAATHVALKQELAAARQELRHASHAVNSIKTEKGALVREILDKSLKMESELRSLDGLNGELAQVHADVQKLSAVKQQLVAELQALNQDLTKARLELQQAPALKADIESMHQELQRGRAAVEYEKKAHADNLEQSQAMEKNMISMAREVEKLRAELSNAEKRARAAAAASAAANPGPGYGGSYGNPDTGYGGTSYADGYGMHQVQAAADGSQYGVGAFSYDMPLGHVRR